MTQSCYKITELLLQDYMILWRIDPFLGKDPETKNGATAVARQRRGKHAPTTIELLLETVLCNPLLGSWNSWTATMYVRPTIYIFQFENHRSDINEIFY
jgi:hypothetical protein